MREKIRAATQLTASAGIAPNKMLAKICSDMNKPNGQYFLESTREAVLRFIHGLSVRKVSGIGKVSAAVLHRLGVQTCHHLYQQRVLLSLLFSEKSFNFFLRVYRSLSVYLLLCLSAHLSVC
eukprot:m.1535436 g.1535436  ORF g.1535436 m.1535436 type:complete len:122 (+) comp25243_c0_seq74:4226-4591(+)